MLLPLSKLTFQFAFGSIFLSLLMADFSWLGWVGLNHAFFLILILWAPLLIRSSRAQLFKWNWIYGVMIFLVLIRVLDAARLLPHGDVLLYHLSATRIWFDTGTFKSLLHNPVYFQISFFEYLYQWGNLMLAGQPGEGLVASELFAQMLHASLGFGGTLLCFTALFETFGLSLWAALLSALMGATYGALNWTAAIAKTDYGISFWVLAAVLFFKCFDPNTPWMLFGLGVLLGVGFFGKLTSGFFIIVFCGYFFLTHLKQTSFFRTFLDGVLMALGILVGGAPIWIRNGVLTGNPFFPTLNGIFKSPYLGPSFQQAVDQHHLLHFSVSFDEWRVIWNRIHADSSLYPLVGIGLILIFTLTRLRKNLGDFSWIAWISFILFLGTVGLKADLRWFGVGWVFLFGVGGAGPFLFLETEFFNLPKNKMLKKIGISSLSVIILGFCQFPYHVVAKALTGRFPYPEAQVLATTGGSAKIWFRKNAEPGARVLTTGENETYFISPWNPVVATVNPEVDALLLTQTVSKPLTAETLKQFLNMHHFRYILDLKSYDGGRFPPSLILEPLLKELNTKVIYQDQFGTIYEL